MSALELEKGGVTNPRSGYRFDAFASYSTSSDYNLVRDVEKFLESFHILRALRSSNLRPLEICVDGSDFRLPRRTARDASSVPGDDLRALLAEHLAESRYLLVFCSPTSRSSPWVEAEVELFLEQRSLDNVLLAVTGGIDPVARPEEVFAPRLLAVGLHHRPWYDLRGARPRHAGSFSKLRKFDEEQTRLAAHLLGDTAGRLYPLWRRDMDRRQRHNRGLALGAIALLLGALLGLAWTRTDRFQLQTLFATAPVAEVSSDGIAGAEVLNRWLTALVRSGNRTRALAAAERVPAGMLRVRALASVAEALARAGSPEEAKAAFDRAFSQAASLEENSCEELVLLSQLRRLPPFALGARAALDSALDATRQMRYEHERVRCVTLVARERAAAGELGGALALLETIPAAEHLQLDLARQAIAADLAGAGQDQPAVVVAGAIKEELVRELTLSSVAEILAKSGRTTAAIAAAHRISDSSYRSTALAAVAGNLLLRGRQQEQVQVQQLIDEALPLARAAEADDRPQGRALLALCAELAKAGDFTRSLAIAEEIRDGSVKSSALAWVTPRMAEAGHVEAALTLARQAPDSDGRQSALLGIAAVLARRGQPDRAVVILTEALAQSGNVTYSEEWDETRAQIARAFVGARRLEAALTLLFQIRATSEWPKAQALFQRTLVAAAADLKRSGDVRSRDELLHQALLRAGSVSSDDARSSMLAAIAKGLASATRLRDARLTADRCPSSRDRLDAYAAILAGQVRQGASPRS